MDVLNIIENPLKEFFKDKSFYVFFNKGISLITYETGASFGKYV